MRGENYNAVCKRKVCGMTNVQKLRRQIRQLTDENNRLQFTIAQVRLAGEYAEKRQIAAMEMVRASKELISVLGQSIEACGKMYLG